MSRRNEIPNYSPQFAEYWRTNPMPRAPGYEPFVLTPAQAEYERDMQAAKQAGLTRGSDLTAANAVRKQRAEERKAYRSATGITA
jgi:hypothetical protein